MSDSHSQSYYEIALTSRQVLGAFLILLVCLVAAFFSGVWIGRGARQTPVAVAAGPDLAEEGRSDLPRFDFFNDDRGAAESATGEGAGEAAPTSAAPAPEARRPQPALAEPDPSTTLVEDLGAAPAPTRSEPNPSVDRRQPREPASEASAGAEAGDLVIQVFSSADEGQARSLVDRLVAGGYPAFLSPDEINGRLMYRVRVGPYASQGEAEAVADRVRQAYRVDTWITR